MQFLVIAYDGTDAEAPSRRTAVRQSHIELGDKMRAAGKHIFGTAILNDAGTMIGSMLVVDFENREALDDWLTIEPYVTGRVWEEIEIRPCMVGPSFVKR